MSPIRVLLVDDHRVIREGLQRMLESDSEIQVVGGAASGEEALVQAQPLCPDVILMDIKMRVMNGVETYKRIKKISPQTAVIMMTAY